jgi:hypothetical protein
MKRCPQCFFLYPDSDDNCDFDSTLLETIDEAAIDAATRTARPARRKAGALPIAAAVGMIIGVLVFAIYYVANRPARTTSAATQNSEILAPAVPSPTVALLPSPSPASSPSPSPSPSPKSLSTESSTAHSRATTDPVSTSGPGIATRQGGKPVITLTSGGKIEADEVWRTKDGVWYRRNGIVTLLKRSQVKTIATR